MAWEGRYGQMRHKDLRQLCMHKNEPQGAQRSSPLTFIFARATQVNGVNLLKIIF